MSASINTAKSVNPADHPDIPLWCVYGSMAFPTIFCCLVLKENGHTTLWGYSTYQNVATFRTLGVDVAKFIQANEHVFFFKDKTHALEYLSKIVTPIIP